MKQTSLRLYPSRKRAFTAALSVVGILLTGAPGAFAAVQTWDGAASGVWDTSALNWGGTAFTSTNDALFTGTPTNNVTTATGLTIGAITLDNTFTGSVTMSGANTVSGATTINGGTLNLTSNTGLGGSAVSIGASGTVNVALTANGNVGNIFTGSGTLTVSGSTGTPNFNNASALNNFTGTFNVNTTGGQKVALTTAGGKIGSGATVNITSGGTLYIANTTTSFDGVTFNVVGSGNTENLGAIRIESNSVIGATSSVVLGGDTSLGSNSGTGTINAAISESTASALTKVGAQTLVLGGNNTYTGATILTAGTLSVSSDTAGAYNLGGGGTNGITFNGGTLQITGTAMTSFGSHALNLVAAKNVNLDIANVANNFTVSQALNSTMTTGQVVKTGAGTLTLSGANTYTGGTRANAGTLVLSGSHTKAAGTTDFLSVNNVGAQNAVLKVTAGTQGFTDINLAEVTNARGAIYQSGGDLSAGSTGGGVGVKVGSGATSYGYYKLSGGTLTNANVDFQVGGGAGATGVMDVSGGSVTTGAWIVLGRNGAGNGLINVTGGSVTSNSQNIALNWANTSGSLSVLNVGGGAGAASVTGVSNATNYFDVSQSNTTGTTGVANLLSNGTLTVGRVQSSNGGGTALFNFNGGTLKATATNSGATFMTSGNMDAVTVYSGGGTIHNNGTNITIGNVLGAATGNGVTSIAVTDGGSGYIGAPLVKFTNGTGNTATGYAVMTDDGTGNGTYKVGSIVITSPGTYSVDPTTITLTGGGASTAATIGTITTGANTSGGMTFAGSGTTTLSGANTYTGATTISAGTLALASAGTIANSSTITVGSAGSSGVVLDLTSKTGGFSFGSGQTVKGIGTINNTGGTGVTFASGSTLTPGNSVGTLSVTGNLILASGSASVFELGATGTRGTPGTSDKVAVSGALTVGGDLTLNDNAGANGNGSAAAGSYQIFTQSGAASGAFSSVTNNVAGTRAVVDTGNADSVYVDLYNKASAAASQTVNIKTRVNVAGSSVVSLTNTGSASAPYQETLGTTGFSGTTAGFTATGSATGIAGGSSGSGTLSVGGTFASSGVHSGSTTLGLQTEAVNFSGLGNLAITDQTVNINVTAYDLAVASFSKSAGDGTFSGSGTSYTLAFGTGLNAGQTYTATIDLANASGSFRDSLGGAYAALTGNTGEFSTNAGTGSISAITAGNSGSITISFVANSVGSYSGTLSFNGLSQQSGLGDVGLSQIDIAITAGIAAIPEPSTCAVMIGALVLAGAAWNRRRSSVRA